MNGLRAGHWRFSPGVWPTLAAALLFGLTLWLGHWQTDRAEQKRALQARYDAAETGPAIHAGTTLDAEAALYRRVEAHGVWDDADTILIDNRVQDGVAGYHVLTPLKLDARHALLVNRGWVPAGGDRRVQPRWATPDGAIDVGGIVVPAHTRYFEFAGAEPQGRVWQNLDFDAYAARLGFSLAPLLLLQTSPADDGLVRHWPRPDTGVAMHQSYALQWYGLAATLAGLWLALNLKRDPRPVSRPS